jgi:hypothetical protein
MGCPHESTAPRRTLCTRSVCGSGDWIQIPPNPCHGDCERYVANSVGIVGDKATSGEPSSEPGGGIRAGRGSDPPDSTLIRIIATLFRTEREDRFVRPPNRPCSTGVAVPNRNNPYDCRERSPIDSKKPEGRRPDEAPEWSQRSSNSSDTGSHCSPEWHDTARTVFRSEGSTGE